MTSILNNDAVTIGGVVVGAAAVAAATAGVVASPMIVTGNGYADLRERLAVGAASGVVDPREIARAQETYAHRLNEVAPADDLIDAERYNSDRLYSGMSFEEFFEYVETAITVRYADSEVLRSVLPGSDGVVDPEARTAVGHLMIQLNEPDPEALFTRGHVLPPSAASTEALAATIATLNERRAIVGRPPLPADILEHGGVVVLDQDRKPIEDPVSSTAPSTMSSGGDWPHLAVGELLEVERLLRAGGGELERPALEARRRGLYAELEASAAQSDVVRHYCSKDKVVSQDCLMGVVKHALAAGTDPETALTNARAVPSVGLAAELEAEALMLLRTAAPEADNHPPTAAELADGLVDSSGVRLIIAAAFGVSVGSIVALSFNSGFIMGTATSRPHTGFGR